MSNNIPEVVLYLLRELENPKTNVYLRNNIRSRLVDINTEITKAITRFDREAPFNK